MLALIIIEEADIQLILLDREVMEIIRQAMFGFPWEIRHLKIEQNYLMLLELDIPKSFFSNGTWCKQEDQLKKIRRNDIKGNGRAIKLCLTRTLFCISIIQCIQTIAYS
jgi:hypothetical protein